jgi:hypothetical protein
MSTQLLSQQTMMARIVEHKMHDCEHIGTSNSGTIYWVAGAEEWLLLTVDEQGQKDWTFGSLEELIACVSDEDIIELYEDDIADFYDDEESE